MADGIRCPLRPKGISGCAASPASDPAQFMADFIHPRPGPPIAAAGLIIAVQAGWRQSLGRRDGPAGWTSRRRRSARGLFHGCNRVSRPSKTEKIISNLPAAYATRGEAMPIEITCTHCRRQLRAPDSLAGKRVKCPGCQAVLQVPRPEPQQESLADLLEDVMAAPQAPAIQQSPARPRAPLAARPAAKRRSGGSSRSIFGLMKENFWATVTLAAGVLTAITYGSGVGSAIFSIIMFIPGCIQTVLVYFSERGARPEIQTRPG